MVRLKEFRGVFSPLIKKYFNSTMVRLKEIVRSMLLPNHCLFQFHNGTIKRKANYSSSFLSVTFQFHNGTIKRAFVWRQNNIPPLFQFHNGTIKSVMPLPHTSIILYFNSTMVRLKAFFFQLFIHLNIISIPQWYD